ncbi:MAG: V-type ATP synthase subunit D [Candidatus Diapherotrites archaeon]|nr:V-type ATP synthase subunit D [Candidatus Diapherotrites archaeon]
MATVKPTRMELLRIRKQIALAEKGHALLKEKRDALVMEFFDSVRYAKQKREELEKNIDNAYRTLAKLEAVMGKIAVESASLAVNPSISITASTTNIMGAVIPKIHMEEEEKTMPEYGLYDSSVLLDETVSTFRKILKQAIELAEAEEKVKILAEDIKKTKRRVNALEYIVLVNLRNTAKYIEFRLEELGRENFFRLKKVKSKLGK